MELPRELYVGDDWSFTVLGIEGTAVVTLLRSGREPYVLVGPDGVFEIPSAESSTIQAGTYQATVHQVLDGKRTTKLRTRVTVLPDPSDPSSDTRTAAEKALDDIDEALAAGAGSDVYEYEIGGQRVRKDRMSLLALRNHYLKLIKRERGEPAISTIVYYM